MSGAIRVLLADDHPLIGAGIETIFAEMDDLQLVGLAADGHEARHLCLELSPDVLVLDLKMPGPSPGETIAYVQEHCPEVKILILSAYDSEVYVREVVRLNIVGYVLKDEATKTLMDAIRTVAQDGTWYSQRIVAKLVRQKADEPGVIGITSLTERERQVLDLMARGWNNIRIAEEFNLVEQTVHNYVSLIYDKLNVNTRAEAVVLAREHGLGKE